MANNSKRGRPSKAAVEEVASSADLLWEILIRLPVKSLLNFKRVSRQWYVLISYPQFRLEHTRRNPYPSPTGLFITGMASRDAKYLRFDKGYRVRSCSKAPCEFPKGLEILDSCNGLLLCSFEDRTYFDNRQRKLYVCNPATKHVARVPNMFCLLGSFVLAFDASTPEKYRIVCNNYVKERFGYHQLHRIDVYEPQTGLLKHSTTIPDDRCVPYSLRRRPIFWNGAVNWLGHKNEALYSFDLSQNCLRETATIPLRGRDTVEYFGACQGHLYMLKVDLDCNPVRWIVYEMEHDLSGLSMKYSIRHDHLFCTIRRRDYDDIVFIFLGEEDELFFVVPCGRKVYTYNAKAPNLLPVQTTLASYCFRRKTRNAHIYAESFAPV